MPFRVGLLLDSYQIPNWQHEIVEYILNDSAFQVTLVVINQSERKASGGRLMYRLLRKIDRAVFKSTANYFERRDTEPFLSAISHRFVNPKQTRFKDIFKDEDIEWVRAQQPDILIRFGFRILSGEILRVARYGVWSLHHGDSAVNRGGPPAFWEVVNQEPITGVTLQVLSEKLDAGQVLGKAFCKTDATSFNRNQQSVYAAGVELFCARLKDLAEIGPEKFFKNVSITDNQFAKVLYRDPQNFRAMLIALVFGWRRLIELWDSIFFIRHWVIAYHQNQETQFNFSKSTILASPHFADWADPFVFRHQGIDYLFFEHLARNKRFGEILCHRMDQLQRAPMRVLEEPYHLSYPTMLEHEGKLYLLVESGAAKLISLYVCEAFPNKWKKLNPLMAGIELYDPTLFYHDGLWYLFGTKRLAAGTSADMYLHIFYSSRLDGEWLPHAMNPITRDVRGSRPAGKIFIREGKLIRPAQLGAPRYGSGVMFMEIIKLSPTEYEERVVNNLLPWGRKILATHTYSAGNGWHVTDAQVRRFRFF